MTNALLESGLSPTEVARRAKEIYRRDIRAQVIDKHRGELLALDIYSGDYEIDRDSMAATDKLRGRRPEALIYVLRIGYDAVYGIGAAIKPEAQ